jgi:hypothetical protein
MSSPRFRTILTGLALVGALTVALPVRSEAAGLSPLRDGGDVWSQVWSWFSELWSTGGRGGDTGLSSGLSSLTATETYTPPPPTTTSAACGGDQGVCIDPNGG